MLSLLPFIFVLEYLPENTKSYLLYPHIVRKYNKIPKIEALEFHAWHSLGV